MGTLKPGQKVTIFVTFGGRSDKNCHMGGDNKAAGNALMSVAQVLVTWAAKPQEADLTLDERMRC